MDRNTIIAFLIIGLILLLWPLYISKVVQPEKPQPVVQDVQQAQSMEAPSAALRQTQPPPAQHAQTPMRSQRTTQVGKSADTLSVETNLYRGRISTLGGGTIISWQLKEHLNYRGEWVELIPDSSVGNLGLVAGIDLSETVFDVETETFGDVKTFRFVHRFETGGVVEKVLRMTDGRYDVDMEIHFRSVDRSSIGSHYSVQWMSGMTPTERNIGDDNRYYEASALQGGELLKTKGGGTGLREGSTQWTAIRTKYFLIALIPQNQSGSAAELNGDKIEIPDADGSKTDWKTLQTRLQMTLQDIGEQSAEFTLYMGPIDYDLLKSYNVDLEKLMNFGMIIIRPFSIAFYYTLQFIYGLVKNYGWAIIIFSILIKVILYPLTRKSFQSMRKMQELQPKMQALKEKYKKDPQRMNQETMKLYKQHGVNPMGGCLPMLLQMPVLFALFNLFRTTIMLRQASFLGLIHDLSAPDEILHLGGMVINVLPVLMTVTMILQQRMSNQNPQQKAMAYMMPVFFMFIFYKLSAGLNLYYVMFNVLTVAQEVLIKKHKASDQ